MATVADTFIEWASQPFQPAHLHDNGAGSDVGERIATSLEYIAAQLGEICRKMDHLGASHGSAKEDFETMSELLKKL